MPQGWPRHTLTYCWSQLRSSAPAQAAAAIAGSRCMESFHAGVSSTHMIVNDTMGLCQCIKACSNAHERIVNAGCLCICVCCINTAACPISNTSLLVLKAHVMLNCPTGVWGQSTCACGDTAQGTDETRSVPLQCGNAATSVCTSCHIGGRRLHNAKLRDCVATGLKSLHHHRASAFDKQQTLWQKHQTSLAPLQSQCM